MDQVPELHHLPGDAQNQKVVGHAQYHLGTLTTEEYDALSLLQRTDRKLFFSERANENLHIEVRELRDKLASYREVLVTIKEKQLADQGSSAAYYYAWMPYEENYLESLSCPILIPADWLRELLIQAYKRGHRDGSLNEPPNTT